MLGSTETDGRAAERRGSISLQTRPRLVMGQIGGNVLPLSQLSFFEKTGSIVSYNGKVFLGVATDQSLIPDPEAIIEFFRVELEEMTSRAQKVRAERQEAMQPMLSMLDQALKTMDELLAEASKDDGPIL